jgi:hypothetical protein
VITVEDFQKIRARLGAQAEDDIQWSESVTAPSDAESFAREAIFVICNSGMKATVAQGIYQRCMKALYAGGAVSDAFGHAGKVSAIERIWREREALLQAYLTADDKLGFCASLPWVGDITKYHLAKNLGADVAKPDVHLQRLADREQTTVHELCERLAHEVGLRVATVDTVLWRACACGVINSRTGEICA